MKRYIEFLLEPGGSLVVEVEEPASEYGAVSVGRRAAFAARTAT